MRELEGIQNALLQSALLGTDKHPFALPTGTGPLTALLQQVPQQHPETALLHTALAWRLCQHALTPLPHGTEKLTTFQTRTPLPRSSEAPALFARWLQRLLTEPLDSKVQQALMVEWLTRCHQGGWMIPVPLLPEVLELMSTEFFQPLLAPVLGPRGRLLACLNTQWSDAVPFDPVTDEEAQTLWDTGDRVTRYLVLRGLRQVQPALAHRLLASTWDEEDSASKLVFLQLFQNQVLPMDEPLLERALDEKRKDIRLCALSMLQKLPQSGLVQRMADRGQQYVSLQKHKWVIRLPEACDSSMIRDGVISPPTLNGWEKRWRLTDEETMLQAHWLYQILSSVPLSSWETKWGLSAEQCLQVAQGTSWERLLVNAWIQAGFVATQGTAPPSAAWVRLLLGHPDFDALVDREQRLRIRTALLHQLSPAEQEAFLQGWLFAENALDGGRLQAVQPTRETVSFSVATSRALVAQLLAHLRESAAPIHQPYALAAGLRSVACRLAPTAEVEIALTQQMSTWTHGPQRQQLETNLCQPFTMRVHMHNAFLSAQAERK